MAWASGCKPTMTNSEARRQCEANNPSKGFTWKHQYKNFSPIRLDQVNQDQIIVAAMLAKEWLRK